MDEIWVIARNCSTVTVSYRVAVRCRARSSPNFDQILSKPEGTCGSLRGLLWTPLFVQLLDTTEKLRNDARLPVG